MNNAGFSDYAFQKQANQDQNDDAPRQHKTNRFIEPLERMN